MNKLKIAFSAITILSLFTANISFAKAEENEPVMTGVYYNADGTLAGVKSIKGNLSDE